jgi:hypothetical protein
VLIKRRYLDGIAAGSLDLQFRRWRRPMVKVGGTMHTAVGVLAVDAVDVVADGALTADDARRAGYDSLDALVAEDARVRARGREGELYRIQLRYVGDDPRVALREDAELDDATLADLTARLARLDRASPRGPWTRQVLELVRARPATLAATLAESIGRDRASFKLDVRKLKNLGLTESLQTGYRISPRGETVLHHISTLPG